ncbi:rhodanese-like domain-containing protein [Fictibacillus gelatini]|uniref:rhodanese-like domain-containing protein n=1 Tax=Fictibacillus gelatini TaxID=225985 RepID=UPI00041D5A03|nr:rhodanese-like domain-containing protein [Fictibacillus gelatini]
MQKISFKEQNTEEVLRRLKNREDVVVLDIREPKEWATGHIPGAKHIPLGEIPYHLQEFNSNKETIVVCRSGKACELLHAKRYNVVNMKGGMRVDG